MELSCTCYGTFIKLISREKMKLRKQEQADAEAEKLKLVNNCEEQMLSSTWLSHNYKPDYIFVILLARLQACEIFAFGFLLNESELTCDLDNILF